MGELRCYEFHMLFERDRQTVALPFLGHGTMVGWLTRLMQDHAGPQLRDFLRVMANPEAFLRMKVAFSRRTLVDPNFSPSAGLPRQWFDPHAGWKAAAGIIKALGGEWALCSLGDGLRDGMRREALRVCEEMDAAIAADIRFRLELDLCTDPPPALVAAWRAEWAETAAVIREVLSKNGVERPDSQ